MDNLFVKYFPGKLKPGTENWLTGRMTAIKFFEAMKKEFEKLENLENLLKTFKSSYDEKARQVVGLVKEEFQPYADSVDRVRKMKIFLLGAILELALYCSAENDIARYLQKMNQLAGETGNNDLTAAVKFLYILGHEPSIGELPNTEKLAAVLETLESQSSISAEAGIFFRTAKRILNGYIAVIRRDWELFANSLPHETSPGQFDLIGGEWQNEIFKIHLLQIYFLKHLISQTPEKVIAVAKFLMPHIQFGKNSQNAFYYYWLGDIYEEAANAEQATKYFEPFDKYGIQHYKDFLLPEPVNPRDRYLKLVGQIREQHILTVDSSLLTTKVDELKAHIQAFSMDNAHFSDAIPITRDSDHVTLENRQETITIHELFLYMKYMIKDRKLQKRVRISIERFSEIVGGVAKSLKCIYIEPLSNKTDLKFFDGQHYVVLYKQDGNLCNITFYYIYKIKVNKATNYRTFNERAANKVEALKKGHDSESESFKENIKQLVFTSLANLANLAQPYTNEEPAQDNVTAAVSAYDSYDNAGQDTVVKEQTEPQPQKDQPGDKHHREVDWDDAD